MALTLKKISLALAFLACMGFGRRLQTRLQNSQFGVSHQPFEVPANGEDSAKRMAWMAIATFFETIHPAAVFNPSVLREHLPMSNPAATKAISSRALAGFDWSRVVGRAARAAYCRTCLSAGEDSKGASSEDIDLWAALRERQKELDAQLVTRWRKGAFASRGYACRNWVRRLAVDWPRSAIGTASGEVLVVDLMNGEAIASNSNAHPSYVNTDKSANDMQLLHGQFDGGGLLALDFCGRTIVSAGRDGGAKIWKLETVDEKSGEEDLLEVAKLREPDGESPVVSRVKLTGRDSAEDGGILTIWLANLDGKLQRWDYDPRWEAGKASPQDVSAAKRMFVQKAGAAVLDIAVLEEHGLIACAHAKGGVDLFSLDSGAPRGSWNPLAFDGSRGYKGERARSVAFVPMNRSDNSFAYCLVVGGSDGSLHASFLANLDQDNVFEGAQSTVLRPSHKGACVSLTPLGKRAGGLFISGAHDGTCKLWDLDWSSDKFFSSMPPVEQDEKDGSGPTCLYGLSGFKPWLGSVTTDGERLVSDGRDNMVIILDFSSDADGFDSPFKNS